jgi:26S proteasome regulatory subunit N5
MSDGSILKATKDFSKEVDAAIPEAEKLAQVYKPKRRVEGNSLMLSLRMAKRNLRSTSS